MATKTVLWLNSALMLGHPPNIKPASGQHLVFAYRPAVFVTGASSIPLQSSLHKVLSHAPLSTSLTTRAIPHVNPKSSLIPPFACNGRV